MVEVIVDVTDEDIPGHRYLDDTDIEIPAACCSGKRGCCGISPGGAAPALQLEWQIQPIPSSDLDTAGTSGRPPRWNVLACGLRRRLHRRMLEVRYLRLSGQSHRLNLMTEQISFCCPLSLQCAGGAPGGV